VAASALGRAFSRACLDRAPWDFCLGPCPDAVTVYPSSARCACSGPPIFCSFKPALLGAVWVLKSRRPVRDCDGILPRGHAHCNRTSFPQPVSPCSTPSGGGDLRKLAVMARQHAHCAMVRATAHRALPHPMELRHSSCWSCAALAVGTLIRAADYVIGAASVSLTVQQCQ
jgi:hypothetical protein